MSIAATSDPAAVMRADARLEDATARPSRLWSLLIAGWSRRLDRQIEDDLRWLDHAGALEDFRSASRG
jgi:hypothetical protein